MCNYPFVAVVAKRASARSLPVVSAQVGTRISHTVCVAEYVDPAFAPGTGTPEVGGFTGAVCLQLLRGLTGIHFIGYDLVEVMPPYDPAGITSLLAANLVYEFIALEAMQRRDR